MDHLYLYAIVERLPPRWRPPGVSVGPAPVVARAVEGFVVLVSAIDALPVAGPRSFALHHDVVGSAMRARALLPLRFGTVIAAAALEPWLRGQRPVVAAALAQVRGCVEMSVKLLRLNGDGPEGADLVALGQRLAERAGLAAWRYRPAERGGNVAASVAFLVPRDDVTSFLARIAPVASHATGVAVVPTGPWPAYSFVPSLDRPPLAPTGRLAPGPAQPRAG